MEIRLDTPLARWRARLFTAVASLKFRITLAAVGSLILGVGLTCAVLLERAERDTLTAQRHRELGEAARTASTISRQVVDLQRALQATAAQLDPATLGDDARLAAFLQAKPILRSMFANLFAADIHGRMRVFADAAGVRHPPVELAERDYFRRTVAEQRAIISEAVAGKVTGEPVIVFTYPLVAAGNVYGVIGGGLRLASRDLLGDLTEEREDDASVLVAVTDARGRLLAHSHRQRLLETLDHEPRLSEAFAEWRRNGRAIEPAGLHLEQTGELVSASGVAGPDWMVWRALPQAELLAPLRDARRHSLYWAGGLIAVMSVAMLALLGWLLRPLKALEHRAGRLFDATLDPHQGWPTAAGEIGQLARVLRHVSAERAQLEAFNTQVLSKLGSVMSAAPVGIAFTRGQRFELVSVEFCRLFGHAEHEMLGQPTALIHAKAEDAVAVVAQVAQSFKTTTPYVGEWEMRRADGSVFPARLRARPVNGVDDAAGTIWTLNDISEQVAARARLEWSATHDALTGLANRKALETRLAALFGALPRSLPAALVMIDLDHFKPINDSAGHAAGDAMLRAVADAIGGCVRASDLVVRLGGDEFALLLEHCPIEAGIRIADDVRRAIADIALPWHARTLRVGASLGIAPLRSETRDAVAWMEAADTACYEVKAQGRGAVSVADAEIQLA